MRSLFSQWYAILFAAASFVSVRAAGATDECPHANVGEACCSGGTCMGGVCYDDAGNSSFCGACVPLPGPPCAVVDESLPCDDAGNVCTYVDDVHGTFANGDSFGVARLACVGGVQPEAGVMAGAPCYAPPVALDGGIDAAAEAGLADGGETVADATLDDAAGVAASEAGATEGGSGATTGSHGGCSCTVGRRSGYTGLVSIIGLAMLLWRRRKHFAR